MTLTVSTLVYAAAGDRLGRRGDAGRAGRRGQPGGNAMSQTHTNDSTAARRRLRSRYRRSSPSDGPRPPSHTTAATPGGRPPRRRQQPAEDFAGRYGILTEKNIFVRNRPPTRAAARPIVSAGPRRPEESLVLTGIAIQEGRHVAFIENSATRSTQRLMPGDTVAGGKVVAVDFDGLEFESNGQKVRVAIGRNFLGTTFVAAVVDATATTAARPPARAAGNAAAPASSSGGGGNVSDIERRRTRERRQQTSGGDDRAARAVTPRTAAT